MTKHNKPLKKSSRGQETRLVKSSDNTTNNYISISFRYFQNSNTGPGQGLQDWKDEDLLFDMLVSLTHITSTNITELQSKDKKLTLYGSFPDKSFNEFTIPASITTEKKWGTLRNIGGQKARIAGFLEDNVFYIVFLDKEHKFYKTNK